MGALRTPEWSVLGVWDGTQKDGSSDFDALLYNRIF